MKKITNHHFLNMAIMSYFLKIVTSNDNKHYFYKLMFPT